MPPLFLLLTCGRCTMQISYGTGASYWRSSSSYLLQETCEMHLRLSHFILNNSVSINRVSRSFIYFGLIAINLSSVSVSSVIGHYVFHMPPVSGNIRVTLHVGADEMWKTDALSFFRRPCSFHI
jgi:hypothetical protein